MKTHLLPVVPEEESVRRMVRRAGSSVEVSGLTSGVNWKTG